MSEQNPYALPQVEDVAPSLQLSDGYSRTVDPSGLTETLLAPLGCPLLFTLLRSLGK